MTLLDIIKDENSFPLPRTEYEFFSKALNKKPSLLNTIYNELGSIGFVNTIALLYQYEIHIPFWEIISEFYLKMSLKDLGESGFINEMPNRFMPDKEVKDYILILEETDLYYILSLLSSELTKQNILFNLLYSNEKAFITELRNNYTINLSKISKLLYYYSKIKSLFTENYQRGVVDFIEIEKVVNEISPSLANSLIRNEDYQEEPRLEDLYTYYACHFISSRYVLELANEEILQILPYPFSHKVLKLKNTTAYKYLDSIPKIENNEIDTNLIFKFLFSSIKKDPLNYLKNKIHEFIENNFRFESEKEKSNFFDNFIEPLALYISLMKDKIDLFSLAFLFFPEYMRAGRYAKSNITGSHLVNGISWKGGEPLKINDVVSRIKFSFPSISIKDNSEKVKKDSQLIPSKMEMGLINQIIKKNNGWMESFINKYWPESKTSWGFNAKKEFKRKLMEARETNFIRD